MSNPTSTARDGCHARYHGTRAAYTNHDCRCPDAEQAYQDWLAARRAQYDQTVTSRNNIRDRVEAHGARRRFTSLFAVGYTVADLGKRLGYSGGRVTWYERNHDTIPRTMHEKVKALYNELRDTLGDSAENIANAYRYHWYTPSEWDGHDMDDPDDWPGLIPADDTPAADTRTADWDQAACRRPGYDPDMWHSTSRRDTDHARAVCYTCPLQRDCLENALVNNETWGVWGGVSENARKGLRRTLRNKLAGDNLAGSDALEHTLTVHTSRNPNYSTTAIAA